VYVVGAQAGEARLNRLDNVLARQTFVVDAWPHGRAAFGGYDKIVPPVLYGPAHDLLRAARVVDVGSINEVDPVFEGVLDHRYRPRIFHVTGTVHVGAQADAGHFETGTAKSNVFHKSFVRKSGEC